MYAPDRPLVNQNHCYSQHVFRGPAFGITHRYRPLYNNDIEESMYDLSIKKILDKNDLKPLPNIYGDEEKYYPRSGYVVVWYKDKTNIFKKIGKRLKKFFKRWTYQRK